MSVEKFVSEEEAIGTNSFSFEQTKLSTRHQGEGTRFVQYIM